MGVLKSLSLHSPPLTPTPASDRASNPLPESSSLQLGPTPRLASPFVTPPLSIMAHSKDNSIESGECADSSSVSSAQGSSVPKRIGTDTTVEGLRSFTKNPTVDSKAQELHKQSTGIAETGSRTGGGGKLEGPLPEGEASSLVLIDDLDLSGGLDLSDDLVLSDEAVKGPLQQLQANDSVQSYAIPPPTNSPGGNGGSAKSLNEAQSIRSAQTGSEEKCTANSWSTKQQYVDREHPKAGMLQAAQETLAAPEASQDKLTVNCCENGSVVDEAKLIAYPTPHVLPHTQPQRLPGLQASKYSAYASPNMQTPDAPLAFYTPTQPYHSSLSSKRDFDRDSFGRLEATLRKTRQELDKERCEKKTMLRDIEERALQKTENAFGDLISELFRKRMDLVERSTDLEKKDLDLQRREELVKQLEVFLSVGQKEFNDARNREGCPEMAQIDLDYAQEQGVLNALFRFRRAQMDLDAKEEALNVRQSTLDLYTQQYKIQARDALEAEIRASLESTMQERIAGIAEAEYNHGFEAGKNDGGDTLRKAEYERGFEAGKEAGSGNGRGEAEEGAHRAGVMEGYHACRQTMDRLQKLRAGKLTYDSPELEFLTDGTHPENLFNRGLELGKWELEKNALGSSTDQTYGSVTKNSVKADMTSHNSNANAYHRTPPNSNETVQKHYGIRTPSAGNFPRNNFSRALQYNDGDGDLPKTDGFFRNNMTHNNEDEMMHAQDEQTDLIELY